MSSAKAAEKGIETRNHALNGERKSQPRMSKAERFWRNLFICMVFLFGAIFYSITGLHEILDKEGTPHAKFSDLILTVLAACVWHVIKNIWEYSVSKIVFPWIDEKHEGLERAHRARRVAKWFFDVVYYSGFTIFSYIFFGPIIPNLLFGETSCWHHYIDYPRSTQLRWAKEYYLIQMGSLLQKIFDQLVNKRNDVKFWEYFLHHFLAFCLMFQSYIANYDRIGIIILITHDITDVFLALTRAQEALKYKIPIFFPAFFIVTFFVWTYFRGVVYTFCDLIPTYWYLIDKHMTKLNMHGPGSVFSDAAFFVELTFLAIMNYFWIYALLAIFFKNLKTNSAKDILKGTNHLNNYDPNLLKDEHKAANGKKEKKH